MPSIVCDKKRRQREKRGRVNIPMPRLRRRPSRAQDVEVSKENKNDVFVSGCSKQPSSRSRTTVHSLVIIKSLERIGLNESDPLGYVPGTCRNRCSSRPYWSLPKWAEPCSVAVVAVADWLIRKHCSPCPDKKCFAGIGRRCFPIQGHSSVGHIRQPIEETKNDRLRWTWTLTWTWTWAWDRWAWDRWPCVRKVRCCVDCHLSGRLNSSCRRVMWPTEIRWVGRAKTPNPIRGQRAFLHCWCHSIRRHRWIN